MQWLEKKKGGKKRESEGEEGGRGWGGMRDLEEGWMLSAPLEVREVNLRCMS